MRFVRVIRQRDDHGVRVFERKDIIKLRALTRESLDLEGGRGGGGGGFVGRFVRKIFLDYYINFSKKS